jgi:hypothetical protein
MQKLSRRDALRGAVVAVLAAGAAMVPITRDSKVSGESDQLLNVRVRVVPKLE